MSAVLDAPHFHDEEAAYAWVEARVWPNGPVCPHCGSVERISKMQGKSTRIGTYKCYACRKPFTVKIGTIFEASHIKLHLWLQAMFLLCSSKKGISSNQLHWTLGVTLKTAWFMSHRIREAFRPGSSTPMGGIGKLVEVDETFIGNDKTVTPKEGRKARGIHHMYKVLSLIDRQSGRAHSTVVETLTPSSIAPVLKQNIDAEAWLMTDEANHYREARQYFAEHVTVNHSDGEYGRGEFHTNSVEGYFSIFKRGMRGIYQHCSKKHLHRYLAEYDFRYSNRIKLGVDDEQRTERAVRDIVGKRLTYRTANRQA